MRLKKPLHLTTIVRGLVTTTGCALLSGCAASYDASVNFNPAQPIRIAVLPFAQVDDKGAFVTPDASLLIDNVGLVSSQLKQTPAQFMQSSIQSELSKASLDIIPPALVEAVLVHNGFDKNGANPVSVDLAKVFAADPAQICPKILACDAVMYGKVTNWDRSYYGIQSVSTIGLDLTIVSASTKKVLFHSSAKDSDSRGLTKGPTGLSNLVLEPLKGLDSAIITELAQKVAERSVAPLDLKQRPEYLKTAAPIIVASAHSAPNGLIPRGGKLTVISYGTPGHAAFFSIGNVVTGMPLVERAPGHYVGEYIPAPGDSFEKQSVTVTLRDDFGRSTHHILDRMAVTYR